MLSADVRRFYSVAAFGLLLVFPTACSLFSSSDSDGDIEGRIAWSSPGGDSEDIFIADMVVSASGKNIALDNFYVQGTGAGTRSAQINGRTVKVHSVVFRDGNTGRSARNISFTASNIRQITKNNINEWAPAINPKNWDQVFYLSERSGGRSIMRMDTATGVESQMLATGIDPNADLAGYILYSKNGSGIWRYNIETGQIDEILSGTIYDPYPVKVGGDLLVFFNSPTRWTGQSFNGKSNFVVETKNGTVHKLTSSSMKEDNPAPRDDGKYVVWHGWPESKAAVYYGSLNGFSVSNPVRIDFRDEDTGAALSGNCWYASWLGNDRIMFNNEDRIYVADLKGNARDTGLRGSEVASAE